MCALDLLCINQHMKFAVPLASPIPYQYIVTLTTLLYGHFVICRPGFDTAYLCAKFDDSSFRDIVGAPEFKMGCMTFNSCQHSSLQSSEY